MLDQADDARRSHAAVSAPASRDETGAGPRLDFQDHLADLEAAGLLTRIDTPINKDTELHPLVRWQFVGGVPEDKRRAFLFTNVIDAKGRKYDIPVVVGALAASPDIYALGMGRKVDDIGKAWMEAIAHPIAPVRVGTAPCQEVVITGAALKAPGGLNALPVPVSTPGFDSAPYLTATLCVSRDPETGVQNMGTYRGGVESGRPARGAHGGARGDRRRRLSALAQIPRPQGTDADRHRDRRGSRRGLHRAAETRHRSRRDGGRRRPRRRADPHGQGQDHRPRRAGRRRDRHRGRDRLPRSSSPRRRSARATAMWRSKPSTCRCG